MTINQEIVRLYHGVRNIGNVEGKNAIELTDKDVDTYTRLIDIVSSGFKGYKDSDNGNAYLVNDSTDLFQWADPSRLKYTMDDLYSVVFAVDNTQYIFIPTNGMYSVGDIPPSSIHEVHIKINPKINYFRRKFRQKRYKKELSDIIEDSKIEIYFH
jgi:hypothetical protein